MPVNFGIAIQLLEYLIDPGTTTDNCRLSADHYGRRLFFFGDQLGGNITAANILLQCPGDTAGNIPKSFGGQFICAHKIFSC